MKLHRFYLNDTELPHDFWMQDKALFHQWTNVLRFQVDRELVLFNDKREERLYRIVKIGETAIHLELVTELKPKIPKTDLYLCFSLLKKDKNDWVIQKGTELGVSHFVPLICDRTEKTGFDAERAEKIAIEASEQCGRTDIPRIREPLTPQSLIHELPKNVEIYIAEQGSPDVPNTEANSIAVLIGPEGGWTVEEKQFFETNNLKHVAISEFTLRAETAAISAATLFRYY